MKPVLIIVLSILGLTLHAQSGNTSFDKQLADSLGSDDYGMKQYVLVILKTGTATITNKAVTDSLFRGHMQNIGRLADAGKLVVAGPLQKNEKGYRGIFILNVKTIDEAKALLLTDPAVKANLFDAELFNWYGSAALPMYLKFHQKVEKKTF
ncbi:MAG TPA: YciI family protein [Flavisolibacter sp.]|nr:YciI family protein [Flavisolibacter sp.]